MPGPVQPRVLVQAEAFDAGAEMARAAPSPPATKASEKHARNACQGEASRLGVRASSASITANVA